MGITMAQRIENHAKADCTSVYNDRLANYAKKLNISPDQISEEQKKVIWFEAVDSVRGRLHYKVLEKIW